MSEPKYEVVHPGMSYDVMLSDEIIEGGRFGRRIADCGFNKSNANLICTALNSHDALVEALRGMLSLVSDMNGDYYVWLSEHNELDTICDYCHEVGTDIKPVVHAETCPVRLAQEALEKADENNE